MYYKCLRVNFRQDGSYINCPDWIKKKKEKINQKNKDYKCFQYAVTVALDYEEIKWNSERVPNIKSFTNKCKQRIGINYKKKDDWKTLEKNNPRIALNILYFKEQKTCPAYIPKISSNCKKQIVLLVIPYNEKQGWHYLAVKDYLHYYTNNFKT